MFYRRVDPACVVRARSISRGSEKKGDSCELWKWVLEDSELARTVVGDFDRPPENQVCEDDGAGHAISAGQRIALRDRNGLACRYSVELSKGVRKPPRS
jgi:hypothetical protein